MPTIDKHGALHAANGQYTFKPGFSGMSYELAYPVVNSSHQTTSSGSSGGSGNNSNVSQIAVNGGIGGGSGPGGGGCDCNCTCSCSCTSEMCICDENCGCTCGCWVDGDLPGNPQCRHRCTCECECRPDKCGCKTTQLKQPCNCHCDCWVLRKVTLEIDAKNEDRENLENYRAGFGVEPNCSHGGHTTCNVCKEHWESRFNAIEKRKSIIRYLVNQIKYNTIKPNIAPNEIRFQERAKYSWHLDLFPISIVQRTGKKRNSVAPDFKLPKEYQYLSIELKSQSKQNNAIDLGNMKDNIREKIKNSQKPGNIRVKNFIADFGEHIELKKSHLDELSKFNQGNPKVQIENLWVADKNGLHRIELL